MKCLRHMRKLKEQNKNKKMDSPTFKLQRMASFVDC